MDGEKEAATYGSGGEAVQGAGPASESSKPGTGLAEEPDIRSPGWRKGDQGR